MAHIDKAFRVSTLSLSDATLITQGTIDPSGVGFEAPEGSLFLRSSGTNSGVYVKTGPLDTNWMLLTTTTSVILSRHNGNVSQTFSTTLTTLLFGTNVRTDSNYTYNSGVITINNTGNYLINFDASFASTTNNVTASQTGIYKNNVIVPGSLTYSNHSASSDGVFTVSSSIMVPASSGDTIKVVSSRFSGSGSLVTQVNGCRLNIVMER